MRSYLTFALVNTICFGLVKVVHYFQIRYNIKVLAPLTRYLIPELL